MRRKESNHYDALVVPCAGFRKIGGSHNFTLAPSDLLSKDEFGMLGGGLRVGAAIEMVRRGQTNTIIFSGGVTAKNKAIFGDHVPPEAEVYKEAFLRRLRNDQSIPIPTILTETQAVNSIGNLRHTLYVAQENHHTKIGIISNKYHLPRLKGQIETLVDDELKRGMTIVFLSAEDEFRGKNIHSHIKTFYSFPQARERIKNEKRGLADLKKGAYQQTEQRGNQVLSPHPTPL